MRDVAFLPSFLPSLFQDHQPPPPPPSLMTLVVLAAARGCKGRGNFILAAIDPLRTKAEEKGQQHARICTSQNKNKQRISFVFNQRRAKLNFGLEGGGSDGVALIQLLPGVGLTNQPQTFRVSSVHMGICIFIKSA